MAANCSLSDNVPPTCSFCPSDIVLEDITEIEIRVNWKLPICSDDSGVLPVITSTRQSGERFAVPGSYEVRYDVSDGGGNRYTGCSFRITLKSRFSLSHCIVL